MIPLKMQRLSIFDNEYVFIYFFIVWQLLLIKYFNFNFWKSILGNLNSNFLFSFSFLSFLSLLSLSSFSFLPRIINVDILSLSLLCKFLDLFFLSESLIFFLTKSFLINKYFLKTSESITS